jgi:AraC-like DNA-binding protein
MKTDHIPLSRSLFDRIAAQGLDAGLILQQAALSPDLVTQPRATLATAEYFALWRAIGVASDDPAVGLRIGAATLSQISDVASMAALHSANLDDAMHKLARYKRLTCPEDIRVEKDRGEAAISFRWMLAEGHAPPLLTDAIFASTLALAQRGVGEPLLPRRVELTRRPQHAGIFARHFGCEVRFNVGQDRLVFDQADLARPFLSYSEDRLAALMPLLESALHEQNESLTLHDRVRHVLARGMRGEPQRMAEIAGALHLSPRTLQRRLSQAGTSYQDVLNQVRRDTARHLLDATDIDTGEIAFLLGFEELNSFTRAFRQWEGQTPQRWRQPVGD